MEDIYDDLENYDDVNAIAELRNENKDLKFKLSEYASSMGRLQKDFDKIQSEFKKLEINYSSLLKTARAEIERKTQMINNLNREKDQMVLNTIQSSNRSIMSIKRNIAREMSNNFNKRRDLDSDCGKSIKSQDLEERKKCNPEKERNEENRVPSVDTLSSGNTAEINQLPNAQNKPGKLSYADKSSASKENVAKVKSRGQSIRNRRKSMPTVSKFSSDEEFEELYSAERDWVQNEEKNRRVTERLFNDKHKISETSGIDEKYSSHHESSRETYYKNKYNVNSDRYKGPREKNDPRHRRYLSPERNRRVPREPYQRPEFGRQRVLESPPVERYDSQRRNRSRDRHRPRFDQQPVKHKIQNDYDEPSNKRARTDSSSRHLEEERRLQQVKELVEEPMMSKILERVHHTSCQSPDHINPDTVATEPVREIFNSEATQQEDPRLLSKKYITKTEADKVVLSTISGRNVALHVIKSWKIPHVDLPVALQQPPDYTDALVQEVYMNIDNPLCNMSMESGEVYSDGNASPLDIYSNNFMIEESRQVDVKESASVQERKTEHLLDSAGSTNAAKSNVLVKENIFSDHESKGKGPQEVPGNQTKDLGTIEQSTKATKYKIPKVKKPDKEAQELALNPLGVLLKQFSLNTGDDTQYQGNDKHNHRLDVDKLYTPEKDNRNQDKSGDERNVSQINEQKTFREIVEGDLELSDETSDCVDKHTQHIKHKTTSKRKLRKESADRRETPMQVLNTRTDKIDKDSIKDKSDVIITSAQIQKTADEMPDQTLIDKKQKTKRKSQKSKASVGEPSSSVEKDNTVDRKTRSETKSKETNKFSELFGDSSSLITPEDLGVIPPQVNTQATKYLPIFEDALDAIGINAETPTKVPSSIQQVEETRGDEIQLEVKQKSKTNKIKASTSNKKRKSKKDNEVKPDSTGDTEVPPNIVLTEPNTNDARVVNTVIISTGVQSQMASDIDSNALQKANYNDAQTIPKQNNIVAPILQIPMAMATSTPYKDIRCIEKELDIVLPESSNFSDGKVRNDVSSLEGSAVSNEADAQKDTDVPDVRIIVRRRRKVVKKS